MKKQKSTLPKQLPAPVVEDIHPFGQIFLLKGDNAVVREPGMPEGKEPIPVQITEEEMRNIVLSNRAEIFGQNTIGIKAKDATLRGMWDAFLFDFTEVEHPRLFLLKITKGITTTMLAMIALNTILDDTRQRTALIGSLKEDISADVNALKRFNRFLAKGQKLEEMLALVIRKHLRSLVVINDDDLTNTEVYEGYAGARPEHFSLMYLRKFTVGKSKMLSIFPVFTELRKPKEVKSKITKEKVIHTEADHFAHGSDTVRRIYESLKKELLKLDKHLLFVPDGQYYIALKKPGQKNAAFFHVRKNTIYLVVKIEEKIVRRMVKKSEVKHLPESVCKFWGAASTGLVISSTDHVKEIIGVLKKLIKG